ncbi:MAG: TetR/AcrR family transcriptional regulator [Turicibacter sp.]
MTSITKQKSELELTKLKRKNEMVKAARIVFFEKGIEQTKMTDVAEVAQVGVASVYRYFKTKADLAIAVAISVWDDEMLEVVNNIMTLKFHDLSGYSQVEELLNFYLILHTNHESFIRFIHDFDAFIIRNQISHDLLNEYEKHILVMNNLLIESIKKGQRDQSIREDIDPEVYYLTLTHSFMSLSQKLIVSGHILAFDKQTEGIEQLRLLKDMALNYVKR